MHNTYEAKHLAADRPSTSRQQGQENEARATANAGLSMLPRGFHAAYAAWNPRHPGVTTLVRVAGTEAA